MTTHTSILAWEMPWAEEPDGLQPMGSQELDTTEPLNLPTYWTGEYKRLPFLLPSPLPIFHSFFHHIVNLNFWPPQSRRRMERGRQRGKVERLLMWLPLPWASQVIRLPHGPLNLRSAIWSSLRLGEGFSILAGCFLLQQQLRLHQTTSNCGWLRWSCQNRTLSSISWTNHRNSR